MALVVYARNPLNPAEREISHKQGTIASLAPKTELPFVCFYNGEPILRKDWGTLVYEKDVVVYATLLQGGDSGKNLLRIVAVIALAAFAPQIAGAIGLGTSTFATSAVIFAGTVLINAVLPPPTLPSNQKGNGLAAPSPTYTLGAQANSARLGSAVPTIYGRHQIYPDLGDQAFVFNSTLKVQTLSQIFVIGQGKYDLSELKIEDSLASSFKEVQVFPLGPGQDNIYGEDYGIYNVVEVAGQELLPPVDNELQFVGPFVITPPNRNISEIHVEVTFPKGLFFANDAGGLDPVTVTWNAQRQEIDEFGDPVGDWTELDEEILTAADNSVLRVSRRYTVPMGRYQVRLARVNAKSLSARVGNDILWTGCCGISNEMPTEIVEGITRIQVVAQASDNLNSNTARRFNLVVQRKIKTWNPETGWSMEEVPTRSLVWAFVDILKSTGVPDSRINLQELYELDIFYDQRAVYFDGVFDNKISLFEALTLVARAGRAVPVIQGGQITMIRDGVKSIPSAMFSMRNIEKGSFSISYNTPTEEASNAVRMTYIDGGTYKPKQITVVQPMTDGDRVSTVDLFGITDPDIARLEAKYLVASNQYRRRTVKFTAEMDGFICRFGDVVVVSHDMPSWGVSGEVIDWDYDTKTITLSEPVSFTPMQAHYIRLQEPTGGVTVPYLCIAGANPFEVVLSEIPYPQPYIGSAFERTRFTFGGSTKVSQLVKIRSISPRGLDKVEISGVIDDPRVYEFAEDDRVVVTLQAEARYAPDLLEVDYDMATPEQKAMYAFYSDPFGRMRNKDVGYTYQPDGAI